MELDCRTPSWCRRIACWCAETTPYIGIGLRTLRNPPTARLVSISTLPKKHRCILANKLPAISSIKLELLETEWLSTSTFPRFNIIKRSNRLGEKLVRFKKMALQNWCELAKLFLSGQTAVSLCLVKPVQNDDEDTINIIIKMDKYHRFS